ncbi:MAG: SDR family oxidoreductase [Ignavibacteria bacterium]|nr:SDR family oxidoreductase [Ignavibacteria bacterium]
MKFNKKSRVVWITGASTGIGKETAIEFSKAGYIVVATGRRKSRLVNLVSEIKFAEKEASAFVCNVASERSVHSVVKRIRERYGKIDILINNAGVTIFRTLLETKALDFDTIINTNLRGAFLCTKAVLPMMIKSRSGHIINISSTAANTTFPLSSVYSASKAGLIAMSNSLREEVKKFNIKVTNVIPGPVETPMWDARSRQRYHNRMMTPKDIARLICQIAAQPKKVVIEQLQIRPIKGDIS